MGLSKKTQDEIEKMFDNRAKGLCPFCGEPIANLTREDFRDELSWNEFKISGLCQKCQDGFFSD